MNAILPLISARRLAEAAWTLGELDRFIGDPDIDDLIAEAVWIADAEVAEDQAPLAMTREARALVLARHDGELAARERQAAALVEALPHDEHAQQRNDYERKLGATQ